MISYEDLCKAIAKREYIWVRSSENKISKVVPRTISEHEEVLFVKVNNPEIDFHAFMKDLFLTKKEAEASLLPEWRCTRCEYTTKIEKRTGYSALVATQCPECASILTDKPAVFCNDCAHSVGGYCQKRRYKDYMAPISLYLPCSTINTDGLCKNFKKLEPKTE